MNKIIYTGTITEYHQWALWYLRCYDVEFINGSESYKEDIRRADICLSIIPDHKTAHLIIPAKLYDYIGMRKKILHFTPGHGLSVEMLSFNPGGVIFKGNHQSKVDDFIFRGVTDYSKYNNEFSIDQQYAKLKALI